MPVTVVPRSELDEFVTATERSGVVIISVCPDFADPGAMVVVTKPKTTDGYEVRA
jgi:hypothetical protein